MNITVKGQKLSLRSRYDITTPDCKYSAVKSLLPFTGGIRVLSADRKQTVARIRKKLSFFHARYDFQMQHGLVYQFWRENLWKGVFVCEVDHEEYRFYQHKGMTYSMFRGERQVAAFVKNRFVVGEGNRYEISANRGEDPLLMVCIALVVDALKGVHGEGFTIDFGYLGPEARHFDESWEPD